MSTISPETVLASARLQDGSDSDNSSENSSRVKPGRCQLVIGGVMVAFAAMLLLLILTPATIPIMLAWCVVEVLFWLVSSNPTAAQLDAQPAEGHWPPAAAKHDLTAFNRFVRYCKESPGRVDYKKYLTGWFQGADMDSIKRENIEEFVAYGFLYKHREQLAAEGQANLAKQMTDQLEQIWDIESPPGYNPDIKFMAHLWEPLNASYRPLLFYLVIELVAYCSRHYLKYKGFRAHRHAGINYYTLHLQSQAHKAGAVSGTNNGRSTSAAPVAVPTAGGAPAAGQQTKADGSTNSSSAVADDTAAGSADTAGIQLNPHDSTARAQSAPATVGTDSTATDEQQQQQLQLHTIMEQSASPRWQQQQQWQDHHPSSGPEPTHSNGNCTAAAAAQVQAQRLPRHQPSTSNLSESDLALLESPFALTANSQFDLAGAGLIPEADDLSFSTPSAAAVGKRQGSEQAAAAAAAAATATGQGQGNGRQYKRAQSMPASAAAATGAAAGDEVVQQEQPQPQPRQQLKQRASCSVLQRRLSSRASAAPGYKMKPLQAALSMALTEAGIFEADVPVVFLHGIGGLPAYLELLNYLEAEGSPLLAIEVKSVAMRLGPVYSVSEVATAVLGMMDKMGVRKACFVAHSYGTFVASYIAKQHPQRMRGCVLIDPVCLGMFMPNLIHNFLYKQPVWQGWSKPALVTYVKALVRSFISREVHVRASVARHFYWTELCAWPEDLPAGSTVLLSGKDDLMDSPEVEAMLKSASHLKVQNNEELTHGAFLLNKEVKQAIRLELQALLATSGSAVFGLAHQLSFLVQPAAAAAAAGAAMPGKASSAVLHAVHSTIRKVQSLHPAGGSTSGTDAGLPAQKCRSVVCTGQAERKPSVSRSHSEGSGLGSVQAHGVVGASKAGPSPQRGHAESDLQTGTDQQ